MSKRDVTYFYDRNVANYHYGLNHPMKPHRLALTHSLVVNYDLFKYMKVFQPRKATSEDMTQYHTPEYIEFLSRLTPETPLEEKTPHKVVGDCPAFTNLYEFCQIYAGGSIDAAQQINNKNADICINWAGGLHHARKNEASGFCYINDIVLAILELLKYHARVLYIDIDIHHGDGVQDAFYFTDRVMTLSFHKYGDQFFPGTGDITEIGAGEGRLYSLNVPLKTGINDVQYTSLFNMVVEATVQKYRPEVIVLQCGADSLRDDRIGNFNLSIEGHSSCVEFVRKLHIPFILLGGGGYTVKNVARCWANETAVCLQQNISPVVPFNEYFDYYAPGYTLHPAQVYLCENQNTTQSLNDLREKVFERLRHLECAPSVQRHSVPKDFFMSGSEENLEDEDELSEDLELLPPPDSIKFAPLSQLGTNFWKVEEGATDAELNISIGGN